MQLPFIAAGIGLHPSFESAINEMVSYGREFKPDPKNAVVYKKIYDRIYHKMYKSLKPFYEEIRDIIGYPEI